MELVPIFPRYLGVKHFKDIPYEVINSWKSQIKTESLKHLHNDSNNEKDLLTINQKLLEDSIFKELKNQILNYSKKYVTDIGFHVEDVQISNSWSYITHKHNKENIFHDHGNSLISGVFYLTKGSDLLFQTDLYSNLLFKTSINSQSQAQKNFYSVTPQEGLLVLFPSHLQHSVNRNEEDIERISIAFNIIPKGEFGPNYAKLYL
jgi:uncharacterized protein (TIGR02466 family)